MNDWPFDKSKTHPEVKKLAWIRVGALGDLLVGAANLKDSHNLFPNADIYIIGDKIWTEIISPKKWPKIKGILVLNERGATSGTLFISNDGRWISTNKETNLILFFRSCDAVVNTRYESLRYAWGPWLARVKIRYGMTASYWRWLYTHWCPALGKDPEIHERDLTLFILRGAHSLYSWGVWGPSTEEAQKILFEMKSSGELTKGFQNEALPALKENNEEVQNKYKLKYKKYWLINPTASRREKSWSAENYKKLILKLTPLLQLKNIDLIALGSPKETLWLNEVCNGVCTYIQPNQISELIDLVRGAQLLICNASSMQFIAASTNTKTLTLIGNANPKVWGPLGPNDKFIKPLPIDTNEQNIFELEKIYFNKLSVDEVFNECREIFNQLN